MKTLTSAALFLFLVTAPLAAAPPVPGTDLNGFGSQIVWPENPEFNTYADRLEAMGVRWARFDLCWWSIAETSAKTYNFNPPSPNIPGGTWNTDGAIQALAARGIEPYVILSYGHPSYDGGQGPSTANGRLGYADYCAAAADRYKDQIDYWEIWNEPNLSHFWGTTPNAVNYTELVKVAAPRIRAADPTAVIIGGVTSGIDQTYLQTCIDNGLLDAVDAITIHPYRIDRPETINSEVTSVRSRIAAATTKSIPVWTGEWGYNTCWSEITDQGQAKMLSRMMVNNLAQDINLSFWFSIHPFTEVCGGIDPNDLEWALVDREFNPRPSYYAMRTVNERLGAPIRRVTDPFSIGLSPTINRQRIQVFEKGAVGSGDYTVAIWLAQWPISDSFTGTTTQVGFTLPAGTTMTAWDGLTGSAVSINPVSAGARTNLNNFSAKDYPVFIDLTLPDPTPSPTPSLTPTASPTPSPSATASPSPSATASPTSSPSPTLSPTPTESPTPTPEPSPSPSPTPEPTATAPGTAMTLY